MGTEIKIPTQTINQSSSIISSNKSWQEFTQTKNQEQRNTIFVSTQ